MSRPLRFRASLAALASTFVLATAPAPQAPLSMEGTWTLVDAYEVEADGARVRNFGDHPQGRLMVDKAGRYSLQIFRSGRPRYAGGAPAKGTFEEFRAVVTGSSTHTGQLSLDPARGKLVFRIETALSPLWEGTVQLRDYTYADGVLSYRVPASASGTGTTAYSLWRKVEP